MAALAAAATLASSMADAQKVMSTGNAQQDMRGATSAEAAAATKQQGEGSNSVLQTSQSMAAAAAAAMAAAAGVNPAPFCSHHCPVSLLDFP
jgi:hypothetical protein